NAAKAATVAQNPAVFFHSVVPSRNGLSLSPSLRTKTGPHGTNFSFSLAGADFADDGPVATTAPLGETGCRACASDGPPWACAAAGAEPGPPGAAASGGPAGALGAAGSAAGPSGRAPSSGPSPPPGEPGRSCGCFPRPGSAPGRDGCDGGAPEA